HAGRQTRCKECTARIDIPRGGLGGMIDGTTPVFTPPVILVGGFVLGAILVIAVWEIAGSSGQSNGSAQSVAQSAPPPTFPSLKNVAPSLPDRPAVAVSQPGQPVFPANQTPVNQTPNVPANQTARPAVSSPNFAAPSSNVPAPPRPTRGPVSAEELARIRKSYEDRRSPLVKFVTSDNQSVRIQSIAPTWAEPGQTVVLRGKGLAQANRVLAIDNLRFREYELTLRVISDSELEVSAPPACEKRPECVFAFEVYTPDGVAITLPSELADASDTILSEFAIIRRQSISVALATFAIVDELGSIQTVNTSRIYLLKPSQPQKFHGVVTKIFRTEQTEIGQVTGAKIEAVTVPAIFPCHLDQMFVGPESRLRRLLVP
ncbi:MAG TPA: hypothetical protein VK137_18590, partial [Planctomycetaceae bacterium]|nr:hypothetical protein [Planctomycetaceae bacterium]